jgi:beta-lactamase class A
LYLAFRSPSSQQSASSGPATATPASTVTLLPAGTLNAASPAAIGSTPSPGPSTPRPAAKPARPRAADVDAGPLSGAASYLAGRSGTVVAAVYDLSARREWTIGQGGPQAEASIVKVDILETLLAQLPPGGLTPADAALAKQMIEASDNDAATALWHAVGDSPGIRTFNGIAGMSKTTLSTCVQCSGFPWPGWGLTTTTPHDQIVLLKQLLGTGGQLSDADRQYCLSLLENVEASQRWGVSGGVPAGVTVALKNGWLPLHGNSDWQVNSIGYVSGEWRNYVMAILSTGNPSEQYGIDTLNTVGSTVWKAMGR